MPTSIAGGRDVGSPSARSRTQEGAVGRPDRHAFDEIDK
jgi:hypothetical protein